MNIQNLQDSNHFCFDLPNHLDETSCPNCDHDSWITQTGFETNHNSNNESACQQISLNEDDNLSQNPTKLIISDKSLLNLLLIFLRYSTQYCTLILKRFLAQYRKFYIDKKRDSHQKHIKRFRKFFHYIEELVLQIDNNGYETANDQFEHECLHDFIYIIFRLLLYLEFDPMKKVDDTTMEFKRFHWFREFLNDDNFSSEDRRINFEKEKMRNIPIYEYFDKIKKAEGITEEHIQFLNLLILFEKIDEKKMFTLRMKPYRNSKLISFRIIEPISASTAFGYKKMIEFNPHEFSISEKKRESIPVSPIPELNQYASVLLNPDNFDFNFNHLWNNIIIPRNNVMAIDTSVFNESTNGYLVLKYYPIFYNAIRRYCSNRSIYPYLSIKGSPGIGKSTMLLYLILRWYQQRDFYSFGEDFIDTIFIKPSQGEKLTLFFKIIDDDIFRFGVIRGQNYVHFLNADIVPFIVYEFHQISNEVKYINSPNDLPLYTINFNEKNSLYIFDEIKQVKLYDFKRVLLNSIGSRNLEENSKTETRVHTFLPTKEEMKMIEQLIPERVNQEKFKKKRKTFGSNLRACFLDNNSIQEMKELVSNKIKSLDFSNIYTELNPRVFLKNDRNNQAQSVNVLIIQVTSNQPDQLNIEYYFNLTFSKFCFTFCEYEIIFPSQYIQKLCQERFYEQKCSEKSQQFDIIPVTSDYSNLRAFMMEHNFHFLMSRRDLTNFRARDICYFLKAKNKSKLQNVFEIVKKKNLFQDPKGYEIVYSLNGLFDIHAIQHNNRISIYYRPPGTTNPCYDSALLEKFGDTINVTMFQVTISSSHNFNFLHFLEFVDSFIKCESETKNYNFIWNLEFWIVSPEFTDNPFEFSEITGYSNLSEIKRIMMAFRNRFDKCLYTIPTPFRNLHKQCDLSELNFKKDKLNFDVKNLFCEITQKMKFCFTSSNKLYIS